MHSTAILAKHWLQGLIKENPQIVTSYPAVNDMLYYFQTTLEHVVNILKISIFLLRISFFF